MSKSEPAITSIYQAMMPQWARLRIWRWRKATRNAYHEARWRLMSPIRQKQWVDTRLGGHDAMWFFVLGCNNSGTTLLDELLSMHPRMRCLPKEGQRITNAIPNSADEGIGRVFTQNIDLFRWNEDDPSSCISRLRYDWAARFSPGDGILLEKSPPNVLRARWLQANFEPSRFLVITRHPYAVCEGIRRRTGHTISEAAKHWQKVHEILEEDTPYLERCHSIKYEELCKSPLETLNGIEEFLSEKRWYTREIVNSEFSSHNLNDSPQKITDFNARSIELLSSDEISIINELAGPQMTRIGYDFL